MALVCEERSDPTHGFSIPLPDPLSGCPEGYPFDPEEIVRFAEMYGHPEEWIKKAQELHGKVERLEAEKAAFREKLENYGMDS